MRLQSSNEGKKSVRLYVGSRNGDMYAGFQHSGQLMILTEAGIIAVIFDD